MNFHYGSRDRGIWERIFAKMPAEWRDAPPSDAMLQCRHYFVAHRCQRLLDLGCGFGRWALFLAGGGPTEIVGLDYAENGIRAGAEWARRSSAQAKFVVARAPLLPFRCQTFDGLLAAVLLDNLSKADLVRTMREVNHVVRPGAPGFFVFNPYLTEADLASLPEGNPTKDCMHVAYTDHELLRCVPGWSVTRRGSSTEGFRILEATYVEGGPEQQE